MKKFLYTFIFSFLILPIVVSAQDPSTSAQVLDQLQVNDAGAEIEADADIMVDVETNLRTPGKIRDNVNSRADTARQNAQVRQENRAVRADEIRANAVERQENRQARVAEIKANVAERKENVQQKIEERKLRVEERRTQLKENVKQRVTNLLGNVYNRLTNIVGRLNGYADKLEEKISSFESRGLDTGNASDLLSGARSEIDNASAEIEAAKATLTALLSEEVSKGDVRAVVDSIKTTIKSARNALSEVISALKNIKLDAGETQVNVDAEINPEASASQEQATQ